MATNAPVVVEGQVATAPMAAVAIAREAGPVAKMADSVHAGSFPRVAAEVAVDTVVNVNQFFLIINLTRRRLFAGYFLSCKKSCYSKVWRPNKRKIAFHLMKSPSAS